MATFGRHFLSLLFFFLLSLCLSPLPSPFFLSVSLTFPLFSFPLFLFCLDFVEYNPLPVAEDASLFAPLFGPECKQVETLSLRGNGFIDRVAKDLFSRLAENKSLQSLILSHNALGTESCVNLSQSLRKNRTLLALNISHNQIDNAGFTALGAVLKPFQLSPDEVKKKKDYNHVVTINKKEYCNGNFSLRCVCVAHNNITEVLEWLYVLETDKALEHLNLEGNPLSDLHYARLSLFPNSVLLSPRNIAPELLAEALSQQQALSQAAAAGGDPAALLGAPSPSPALATPAAGARDKVSRPDSATHAPAPSPKHAAHE